MLRTTIGLSLILVLGGFAACSSKSTDDHNNSGGNGAIVGGTGGTNNSGGTTATGAGTAATGGGTRSTAGTTSTGGIDSGLCADTTITCVDATHAMGCNTTTGVVDTFSCVDEFADLGFVSSGCTTDATGDTCDVTGVSDAACQKGTAAYAFCANATTDEELFNIYVNCFQDWMGAHTIVPCFANYVSETMTTDADCLAAEDACFGAGGAGPVDGGGGAGGAP
jgi:hypothetical protein